MGKTGMNLQDSFLNQVRKDNTEIQLVLLDGARLTGYVRGFDNFTVILGARGQQHLIYKHAIAQIISRRPNHEPEREPQNAGQPHPPGESSEAESVPEPQEHQEHQERQDHQEHPERPDTRDDRRPDRRDRPRRDNAPRRDREEPPPKPKFNAIDLSNLKIDEPTIKTDEPQG